MHVLRNPIVFCVLSDRGNSCYRLHQIEWYNSGTAGAHGMRSQQSHAFKVVLQGSPRCQDSHDLSEWSNGQMLVD